MAVGVGHGQVASVEPPVEPECDEKSSALGSISIEDGWRVAFECSSHINDIYGLGGSSGSSGSGDLC